MRLRTQRDLARSRAFIAAGETTSRNLLNGSFELCISFVLPEHTGIL